MRLEIRFRHMPRSEALENLVSEKIAHAVDGFMNRHDAHIQVWLVSDLNRTSRGAGSFICEIEVRYPRRKGFFIQKGASDMHVAIQEAAEKLQDSLTNAGKKETDHRHADIRQARSQVAAELGKYQTIEIEESETRLEYVAI